jgi:hypothetical protein
MHYVGSAGSSFRLASAERGANGLHFALQKLTGKDSGIAERIRWVALQVWAVHFYVEHAVYAEDAVTHAIPKTIFLGAGV